MARLDGLHAIVDLEDAAVPPAPAPAEQNGQVLPPVTISYELPWDGMVTIAIDGPGGKRVKNLVTREERKAGPQKDGWDLTDDAGRSVKPGKYTAKIIAHPPFDLRYLFTVYPNVSQLVPENSPWLNGHHGPGGWLADHSGPSSIAAARDTLYIGAPCAESGVSLIEIDLRGAKRWGYHTLHEGFGGPWFLATDGKTLFVTARATMLWSFDIETKSMRQVMDRRQTASRKDHVTGMAALDGRVYLAHRVQPWLTSAMSADDVDIDSCLPRYRRKRAPAYKHEVVPDPQGDFLRLIRLVSPPPGHGQDIGLVWLESTRGLGVKQYILIAFKRPVPIGSIVIPIPQNVDYGIRFSFLKRGAPYPPDPAKEEQWEPFDEHARTAWDIVPAPERVITRALLVTFHRKGVGKIEALESTDEIRGDDVFDLEKRDDKGATKGLEAASRKAGEFRGRLEGLRILRRRYINAAREARVVVNSGTVAADGTWDAERDRAVSEDHPAIYALLWDKPRKLRGLAVKEIDGRTAKIDVFKGTGAKLDIEADEGWENVATYRQPLRLYYGASDVENSRAPYLDGVIPFPEEVLTRGVRIRIVEQYVRQEQHYPYGFRIDQGGMDWNARRCRIYGVAALEYVGGEPPVAPLVYQRIEELDGETGTRIREVTFENAGQIAFGPDKHLYGISNDRLVRVDLNKGRHKVLVNDLVSPKALAIGGDGSFYVFDDGPQRRNIRAYSPAGRFIRAIGKSGGRTIPGPWDVNTFVNVSAMAVDRLGKLWVVENNYWPKRVSV